MTQRKPDSVKKIQGTFRADRAQRKDPAAKIKKLPVPPTSLPADARMFWRRIGSAAIGIGSLARADLQLLELCCTTLALRAAAEATVAKDGHTVPTDGGSVRAHPCIAVVLQATAQAAALLDRLGLSPKIRGLDLDAPVKPDAASNPWLQFSNIVPIKPTRRRRSAK